MMGNLRKIAGILAGVMVAGSLSACSNVQTDTVAKDETKDIEQTVSAMDESTSDVEEVLVDFNQFHDS